MNEVMNINLNETMEKLAQATLGNAESLSTVISRIEQHEMIIKGFGGRIRNCEDKTVQIEDEISQLKLHEEITTEQSKEIRNTATARLREIFDGDPDDWAKYSKSFYGRIYKDARESSGLASSIDKTKKRDYQKIIDFMEAWRPKEGIREFKRTIDERAAARKYAKKNGY